MCYFAYSDYLKNKYGEKVYKLPINLPVTCPNRDGTKGVGGCIFCSGAGASYELLDKSVPVREQLLQNMAYMGRRFGAKKFIAYFQNYSNTYLPVDEFAAFMRQAVMENVVEISVSTRPDCVLKGHLDALAELYESGVNISLELGLQSANDGTLKIINRGHTVADFVNACRLVRTYPFEITAHLILNLPWDSLEDVIAAGKAFKCLVRRGKAAFFIHSQGHKALPNV